MGMPAHIQPLSLCIERYMGNRLSKIYTRTGDTGTTALANNTRLAKTDLRIEVMGDIDELNCLLGLLQANTAECVINSQLQQVQQCLFDIGAELALPGHALITAQEILNLECWIDQYNLTLPPLKEFILPAGGVAAATAHLARAVCRRAERHLWGLENTQTINTQSLRYINRLSDLLFCLPEQLHVPTARRKHCGIVDNKQSS